MSELKLKHGATAEELRDALGRLCNGKNTMRVPAQADDHDLLLAGAIEELVQARADLEAARGERDLQFQLCREMTADRDALAAEVTALKQEREQDLARLAEDAVLMERAEAALVTERAEREALAKALAAMRRVHGVTTAKLPCVCAVCEDADKLLESNALAPARPEGSTTKETP